MPNNHENTRAEGLIAEQFTAPLLKNMPRLAGDFSHEGIQRLGNPLPMLVVNDGDELLELFLEPSGQDYWLKPKESFMVTSYGDWPDYPFETIHEPGCIVVWVVSCFATVTFRNGNEVPGGYQRPAGAY